MIYHQVFQKLGAPGQRVRASLIGTGQYATAILAQSRSIPALDLRVIADVDLAAARTACRHAGYTDADWTPCESTATAAKALERGGRALLADARLMMSLPLDVVVEATGVPAAGALHAAEALASGKHVAMVTKETDAVVGPILKRRADRAGLVYSAVDGDQHGLLMGLVDWARLLGLEILCAGKALEFDAIFDPRTSTIRSDTEVLALKPEAARWFGPSPAGETARWSLERRAAMGELGALRGYDITEMVVAANATGLLPDLGHLQSPVLRIAEMPHLLCPNESGGLFSRSGVLETVTCLRDPHEPGLAGGVFVIVRPATKYARDLLVAKGHVANARGDAFLISRAHHLCGVETPMTILAMGLAGVATGATTFEPRLDVIAETRHAFRPGETFPHDKSPRLRPLLQPATAVTGAQAVPFHLAEGCRIAKAIPSGAIVTLDMIEPPKDSVLWTLRREQDEVFGLRAKERVLQPA